MTDDREPVRGYLSSNKRTGKTWALKSDELCLHLVKYSLCQFRSVKQPTDMCYDAGKPAGKPASDKSRPDWLKPTAKTFQSIKELSHKRAENQSKYQITFYFWIIRWTRFSLWGSTLKLLIAKCMCLLLISFYLGKLGKRSGLAPSGQYLCTHLFS